MSPENRPALWRIPVAVIVSVSLIIPSAFMGRWLAGITDSEPGNGAMSGLIIGFIGAAAMAVYWCDMISADEDERKKRARRAEILEAEMLRKENL